MSKLGLALLFAFGWAFSLHFSSIGNEAGPLRIVVINKMHEAREPIAIRLTNRGKSPVTFCVEVGASTSGRPAPRPDFEVERWIEGKWNNQLIGPDVGSFLTPEILGAGESKDFKLVVFGPGRYRLRLSYVLGDGTVNCAELGPNSKRASSSVFVVK